jgi:hypothetical protein
MVADFTRVTPAELERAPTDTAEVFEYLDALDKTGDLPAEERGVYVDKAWHALWYLLNEAESPLDLLFDGYVMGDKDADWDGWRPSCFTVDEVAAAAEFLTATPYERLREHFDAEAMEAEDIYPSGIWVDEADTVGEEYLKPNYEALVRLFAAAAKAGDAVVMTIS